MRSPCHQLAIAPRRVLVHRLVVRSEDPAGTDQRIRGYTRCLNLRDLSGASHLMVMTS